MLNKEKHQLVMGRILRDIYTDTSIAPIIGLKGGTCAYFFYGLARFSVDLDFDLVKPGEATQKSAFERLQKILEGYGMIKESRIKRFTVFFVLSYGDEEHNVKLEVNIRTDIPVLREYYELKEYLGISMLAAKKPYLFAGKLAALTLRSETAMRDIYDIWFFAKNNWDVDEGVVRMKTGNSLAEHLAASIAVIEQVKDNEILRGIGELLSEKEKVWVKQNLREEAIFMLKNYMSVLKP